MKLCLANSQEFDREIGPDRIPRSVLAESDSCSPKLPFKRSGALGWQILHTQAAMLSVTEVTIPDFITRWQPLLPENPDSS